MGMIRTYTLTQTLVDNVLANNRDGMDAPWRGKIRRVRAVVTAGTAINQVAVAIMQTNGVGGSFDTILQYALTPQPLDSIEAHLGGGIFYEVPLQGADQYVSPLFIEVATDDATADHTVTVQLTIESPAPLDGYGMGVI